MAEVELFSTNEGKLAYHTFGNGPKFIITFHGFGQDGEIFKELISSAFKEYTVFSFDLFFHGQSQWKNGDIPLQKNQWKTIIESFLKQQKIDSFEILAFSLGAKFGLLTLEQFAPKINKITLLAPDGIGTSFWYNLATYPIFFQRIFKSLILKPGRFGKIIQVLYKMRLADKGLLKFASNQMKTEEQRKRVYNSWVIFKPIKPDLRLITALIKKHRIPSQFFLGEFDRVIKAKRIKMFEEKLDHSLIHILNCGHNQLIRNVKAFLAQNP